MDKVKRQSIGLMVIAAVFVVVLGGVGVIMATGNTTYALEGDLVCPQNFDENANPDAPENQKCVLSAWEDLACPDGQETSISGECKTVKVTLKDCPVGGTYNPGIDKCVDEKEDAGVPRTDCPVGYTVSTTHPNTTCDAAPLGTTSLQCPFRYRYDSGVDACFGSPSLVYYACPFGTLSGDMCYHGLVEKDSDEYCWGNCDTPAPAPVEPTEPKNPQTADMPVIVICAVALVALGYGAYKFKNVETM